MIVVDASVWIATLLPPDVHYVASRRWMHHWGIAGDSMVAPAIILPEIAGAVSRRVGQSAAGRDALADVLANPAMRIVALDVALAQHAATIAADLKLRGADAVYVELARREGVPLVTWDREQLSRAQGVIAVSTPDDAP